MEILIAISNVLIFGLIALSQILLLLFLKKRSPKNMAAKYFLVGLILMAVFIAAFAAWADISDFILLNHYDYRVDDMNYENVLLENRDRVDRLVTSIMGIGWPLKAIFGFAMAIPYLIIVYLGEMMIVRLKQNKNDARLINQAKN